MSVRYEKEIMGSAQWQLNRGHVLAHRSSHVSDGQHANLEHLLRTSPQTTYGALRDAMDARRVQGDAVVHALICAGRDIEDPRGHPPPAPRSVSAGVAISMRAVEKPSPVLRRAA